MINELVIVTGASGAGKTAISKNAIDQYPERFVKFITSTTRDLRETEKEGVDYYHVPLGVFKQNLVENKFFEAEEVYQDMWYGFSRAELERVARKSPKALAVTDVNGALKFLGKRNEGVIDLTGIPVKVVYIYSQRQELIDRIVKDVEQGNRNDSPTAIEKRIKRIDYELALADQFDVVIENPNGRYSFAVNDFLNYIMHK